MTTKPIWTGKYAGIDASVILRGSLPQPYLAGQLAVNRYDSGGIMEAAVRELAAENEQLRDGMANLRAAHEALLAQNAELRNRVAKYEPIVDPCKHSDGCSECEA